MHDPRASSVGTFRLVRGEEAVATDQGCGGRTCGKGQVAIDIVDAFRDVPPSPVEATALGEVVAPAITI